MDSRLKVTPVTAAPVIDQRQAQPVPSRDVLDALIRGRAQLIVLTLLLVCLSRLVFAQIVSQSPQPAGVWLDSKHCSFPYCFLSPDSYRYSEMTSFFVLIYPVTAHPDLVDVLQRGADFEGASGLGVRDGIAFSYLSAWIAIALGTNAATSNALLALLCGVALVFVVRALFLQHCYPIGPFFVFLLSPLVLFYSNNNLKETADVLALVCLITLLLRGRFSFLCILLSVVLFILLYFDREYYLYGAFGVYIVDRLYRSSGWKRAAYGCACLVALWVIVAKRGFNTEQLGTLFAGIRPGQSFLSPDTVAVGIVRSLVSPVSTNMSEVEVMLLLLNLALFCSYAFYVWVAMQILRNRQDFSAPIWRRILNPYLVVFLAAMLLFSVAYGGSYRGRDALSILFFLGLANMLKLPWTMGAETHSVVAANSSGHV